MSAPPQFSYSLCYSREIEQLYKSELLKLYLPVDRALVGCKLSITAFLVTSILLGALPASKTAAAVWFGYLATLYVQYIILQHLPEWYASNRDWLVVIFKAVLALLLMGLVVTFTLEPIHSLGVFVKVIMLGGGVVLMNCTGVCMPYVFRHHVKISLAVFFFYNAALLPAVVDTLLCTAASRQYLQSLYSTIDTAAFHLGGMILPVNRQPPDALPRAQAYTLLLWLQAYLCLLLPSVYLYCYEIRSRTAFLKQLAAQQVAATGTASDNLLRQWDSTSTLAAALPSQPLMLLISFVSLMGVVIWNVLHLASQQLVPWIDGSWSAVWMSGAAAQYGAGSCITHHLQQ